MKNPDNMTPTERLRRIRSLERKSEESWTEIQRLQEVLTAAQQHAEAHDKRGFGCATCLRVVGGTRV